MKKYFVLLILSLGLIASSLCAAESFTVRNIQVEGLQRISADTVYSYLPIKRGQVLDSSRTSEIINALYQTGFFEHIDLERRDDTLVVNVVERPTIGQLKITGNRIIPTEKLNSVMKNVEVTEGRVFNRVMLNNIKQSLLNQYYSLGRYNARVDVKVSPMTRNRVSVNIDISEGLVAVIRRINIIGAKGFTERQLERQLTISTPGIFTLFTERDRFSQEKLDESLENLRNFYADHGYIRFSIQSSQVEITPDRKSIYVTIVVKEGDIYTVKDYALRGQFIVSKENLNKLIKVKPGSVFSRKEALASQKAISDALGEKGYILANVSLNPQMDNENKQVFLVFLVKPGKRVYVHRIYFNNNSKTNDVVLRRELTQMEGAVVSSNKLEQSKRNLGLLPYIKDVQMSLSPVPGKPDQVDATYKVTEDSSAQANFSIGYSQIYHVLLGVGFNQKNFLGTGKTLGVNLTRSQMQQDYGISYTDPYYTLDGISRSINISASKFNPRKAPKLSRSYSTDEYDVSVIYGIPMGPQTSDIINKVQLGYGYQSTLLNMNNSAPSQQVTSFVNNNGRHFQQIQLLSGVTRDGRDRAIFPTKGVIQALSLNVYLPIAHSLSYYIAEYTAKGYLPITENYILTARGQVGYGNSFTGITNYPFFKNFFTGGIDSVRGYLGYTLGPKDSNANATGGNELINASLGFIFPNPFNDTLRTSLFVDAGNVYNSFDNRKYGGSGSGPIRYAAGIEADWLSPMGMVELSLAKPINFRKTPHNNNLNWGDTQELFQFSLGANFG